MNIRLRPALFAIGVIVVCVGVASVVMRASHENSASHTASAAAIPSASVALVKRASVANSLTVAGEFLPYQEVELHAKVSGYIRKINVDIGDHVRTGQVLAVLEVPELNAQVVGADAGVRHSRDEIARAEHEVARATAAHAALHGAAARLREAAAARSGLIAQQELDDAEARDRAAEAQVEAAKSALSAAQQQLDISRATHTEISAMQDYSRIVAPFDGIVTWRFADTGALIQAGTSNVSSMPVVKLAQCDRLRLRLPVPESIASSIRIGAAADVTVQATKEHFSAKVARFTDALDRATRTMQVELDVQNPNYKIAPGMYADVTLQTEVRSNTLTVPIDAVKLTGSQASVLIVDSSGRIQARAIQLGIEDADHAEVLSGLSEGDRVIVGNLSAYQPGEVVNAKLKHSADADRAERSEP
jgi:RND family efflux transporter MFP subunit